MSARSPLRVAIVGVGPAGAYAAEHLLRCGEDVQIELFDRLPTPWGLVRSGVAPDHQNTKAVMDQFAWMAADSRVRMHLYTEIGTDIAHRELRALHHAVVYATGAPHSRRLGIAGEDLPGSMGAAEFVGWYNGHPDFAGLEPDLSHERVVVVGNGNVALDIARILTLPVERLRRTDIADHALEALARSAVREVVVVGRRGPAQAAFTTPELLGLRQTGVRIDVVPPDALRAAQADSAPQDLVRTYAAALKTQTLREIAGAPHLGGRCRVVLRFCAAPVALHGAQRVEALDLAATRLECAAAGVPRVVVTDEVERLSTGLVLRSTGFASQPLPGLPFDEAGQRLPNRDGRVLSADGDAVPGVYATGWVKRGSSGVIGTNKDCALRTVTALLHDYRAGQLPAPSGNRAALDSLLGAHRPRRVDLDGWRAIDQVERERGLGAGRPRVKLTVVEDLLAAAEG
ncbi:FAD-dependent oxidoreductase [Mycolicibacterium sp. XJ662]